MNHGMTGNQIIDFSSGKLDENTAYKKFLRKLEKTGKQFRIALMPDAHIKPKLESPSSAAVAIKDSFSLKLTSPSPNCGMAFIQLPFSGKEVNKETILTGFFSNFCQQIPLDRKVPVLERNQVLKILKEGAEALVDVFGINQNQLKNYEFEGNIFKYTSTNPGDIHSIIPEFLIDLSQYRFGILGGGNHFLEFQEIEEIYDPAVAAAFNMEQGQASILFHTGSDAIGSLIGRIYTQRKKTSIKMNVRLLPEKLKFHLRQSGFKNIKKYFHPSSLNFSQEQELFSQDVLNAYYSAFNFGYANRFYIFDQIIKSLENVFKSTIDAKLLVDMSHNSIVYEKVENENYWVHRHNALRIAPNSELDHNPVFSKYGHPLILPGTDRTSTYICMRGSKTEKSLNSIDHGFGNLIYPVLLSGNYKTKKLTSKMYNYTKNGFIENALINDNQLWDTIQYLESEEILKPVARLRPLATLKGPKPKIN
jgi:tRNA-splicing ligase RtcB